jgi:hypothetical protein
VGAGLDVHLIHQPVSIDEDGADLTRTLKWCDLGAGQTQQRPNSRSARRSLSLVS